jgi:hypothetical protein
MGTSDRPVGLLSFPNGIISACIALHNLPHARKGFCRRFSPLRTAGRAPVPLPAPALAFFTLVRFSSTQLRRTSERERPSLSLSLNRHPVVLGRDKDSRAEAWRES